MNRRQAAGVAGMVGAVSFVGIFSLLGATRPGYTAVSMPISQLATGPNGWGQVINFLVLGGSTVALAGGARATFPEGRSSVLGPGLLGLIGLAIVGAGVFVTDPRGIPADRATLTSSLHYVFASAAFALSPLSIFAYWWRFRSEAGSGGFAAWSLLTGLVNAAAVLTLRFGLSEPPASPTLFDPLAGAVQRVSVVSWLSWLFTFSLLLFRRNREA